MSAGLSISTSVQVQTPSRLHFGLLSFGHEDRPQYGGVGAMVDRPGIALNVRAANEFCAVGPLAGRVRKFAKGYARALGRDALPSCRIEVTAAPPCHVGLGTGTQLGLAVVAGLARFEGGSIASPEKLARLAGRGARSSIGTFGFCRGGLIYEEVKTKSEPLAAVVARIDVPAAWRWLLIRPQSENGLAGGAERAAFNSLPPVPPETTENLREIVRAQLIPALDRRDCEAFGESIYQYGILAGGCFAARQSGPFATPRLAHIVETIRDLGVAGTGQSSWGPTIFSLLPSHDAAESLRDKILCRDQSLAKTFIIAGPANSGAEIKML